MSSEGSCWTRREGIVTTGKGATKSSKDTKNHKYTLNFVVFVCFVVFVVSHPQPIYTSTTSFSPSWLTVNGAIGFLADPDSRFPS